MRTNRLRLSTSLDLIGAGDGNEKAISIQREGNHVSRLSSPGHEQSAGDTHLKSSSEMSNVPTAPRSTANSAWSGPYHALSSSCPSILLNLTSDETIGRGSDEKPRSRSAMRRIERRAPFGQELARLTCPTSIPPLQISFPAATPTPLAPATLPRGRERATYANAP